MAWGELSVSAHNRKEILAELLPRLTALRNLTRIDTTIARQISRQ